MPPKAAPKTASKPRKPRNRKPLRIPSLPPEVHKEILSLASQSTLLSARLVNKNFSSIATPLAFRHLYLGSKLDCDRLVCLSKSPNLSALVEEIDLVGWIERGEWLNSYFPWRMLAILPYIRKFRNLKSFYLGIALHSFNFSIASRWGGPEVQAELRGRLLFTLFACIAGEWTKEEHASLLDFITRKKEPEDDTIDVQWMSPDEPPPRIYTGDCDEDALPFLEAIEAEFGRKKKKKPKPRNRPPDAKLLQDPLWQSWETLLGPALPLETLSIGGLAHSDELAVFNTTAFKKLSSLRSLTKLKFSVSPRSDGHDRSVTDMFRAVSPMLDSLPNTLLCPSIADNLRVLSLYGPPNFGWYPPLDLRHINCQEKSPLNAGLPNLRVLALGEFAFTQTWQVDWIASLGKGYGGGGLEELYLDNCNVLSEARKFRRQTGETTIFPDVASVVRIPCETEAGLDHVKYDLRWHHILNSWRQSMTSLKIFIMGQGDHNDSFGGFIQSVVEANYPDQLPIRSDPCEDPRFFRHEEKAFLNYNAPSPPHDADDYGGYYKRKNRPEAPQYKFGVGMRVRDASEDSWYSRSSTILHYIKFDGGKTYDPWTWIFDDERGSRNEGMKTDEPDTVREDMKAYESLLATVKTRAAV
ncbi:F-box domain protein [Colletotrichum kahawae]|uniref:F-box domain protein n=1 Tax=Colletotrichum kahawae TaxID=34407 RepID=A0AAD9YKK1_COLKA|nr:F-box domain protein [Colletotrichum kahawae]